MSLFSLLTVLQMVAMDEDNFFISSFEEIVLFPIWAIRWNMLSCACPSFLSLSALAFYQFGRFRPGLLPNFPGNSQIRALLIEIGY